MEKKVGLLLFYSRKVSLSTFIWLFIIHLTIVISKYYVGCPEFGAYWPMDSETTVSHDNNCEGKQPL